METYCGPPSMVMLPRRCPVWSSKTVSALVPATQSWLLPPLGRSDKIATARPNTGLSVLKVCCTAHVEGSTALTRVAPFPATYRLLVIGSDASSVGCPGRLAVQIVFPVLAAITLNRPMFGCVT